ncbi:unnamed protein product [Calypogeia fissa]
MAPELDFLPSSIQATKGESFASILERFSYSFGKDLEGKEILPPAIPLCRMQKLELVQNLNADSPGVSNLKDSLMLHGYVKAIPGFQLLLVDDRGEIQPLMDAIRGTWDSAWTRINDAFEAECDANPTFHVLKDQMFPVRDGNHRLFLWMQCSKGFPQKMKYHPSIDPKKLRTLLHGKAVRKLWRDPSPRLQYYMRDVSPNPVVLYEEKEYLRAPISIKLRQMIARYRLSSHHLAVEEGRWKGVKRQDRVCTLCDSGSIENEYHVFITCRWYQELRVAHQILVTDLHDLFKLPPKQLGLFIMAVDKKRCENIRH